MYLDGASVLQLKNFLESNHIKTLRGKDEWSTDTIKNMLRNEKYAGDVIYQKTLRTDPISKRTVINRGQKEKYLVSNNHPAIIDRDTFTLVQTPFNGNFAFVQIRAISTRKKHLRKQVLFSVIFALRRVILPFGQ